MKVHNSFAVFTILSIYNGTLHTKYSWIILQSISLILKRKYNGYCETKNNYHPSSYIEKYFFIDGPEITR